MELGLGRSGRRDMGSTVSEGKQVTRGRAAAKRLADELSAVASADLTGKNILKFGIESKRSCPATSTERFRSHVADALREMRRVCELGQVEGAKL